MKIEFLAGFISPCMKVIQKGNELIIKKNDEYLEIEFLIASLVSDLESTKAVCEDRNSEDFPLDSIRRVIDKCEKIKTKGNPVKIREGYKKHAIENREICEYFQNVISKANEDENRYLKKVQIFKEFACSLEKALNFN